MLPSQTGREIPNGGPKHQKAAKEILRLKVRLMGSGSYGTFLKYQYDLQYDFLGGRDEPRTELNAGLT